jgi:hypothetical protein
MTHNSSHHTPRRGRVFPSRQLSPEEKIKRQAEWEEFNQRCQVIFERVQPELIQEHYDWFMFIEPDSADYFLNPDEMVVREKAREKHPHKLCLILRMNETGVCGRI